MSAMGQAQANPLPIDTTHQSGGDRAECAPEEGPACDLSRHGRLVASRRRAQCAKPEKRLLNGL
ncbi:hypothetical protein ACVWWN_004946 [Mycobacterium sp. URHB0021]|jgi:hypothetical protein